MNTKIAVPEGQKLGVRYQNARVNLLLAVGFTVINILLFAAGSDSFFLFSTYVPYVLVIWGMLYCGLLPADYGTKYAELQILDKPYFAVFALLALIILAVYVVCWLCSKNRVGWMIAALSLFSVDTVLMLAIGGVAADSITDIMFHAWVIVSLAMGVHAYFKLKKLPQAEMPVSQEMPAPTGEAPQATGGILRVADPNVRARVLLQTEAFGHSIVYRRAKRVNELIVDGNVYDEVETLIEYAHTLKAQVDGHLFEAEFDGKAHSYIKVDGQIVAKKLRLM